MMRALLAIALTAACGGQDALQPYYPDAGAAPVIDGIEPASENGNVGGTLVTITGSSFGNDPGAIAVAFASKSAEVVSVGDGALVVRAPQGPIEGGPVDVTVGTLDGRSTFEGGYTYTTDPITSDEVGYVSVNNYWFSCYGGLGEDGVRGCDSFAYIGDAGTDGKGEFLEFVYPRVHTPNIGFYSGIDEAGSWRLQVPGQVTYAAGIEDLRSTVGAFRIVNRTFEQHADEIDDADATWCADLTALGTWRYPGETRDFDSDGVAEHQAAASVGATSSDSSPSLLLDDYDDGACDGEDQRLYDMAELRFCETPTYSGEHSYEYGEEWPIGESFFRGWDDQDRRVDGDGTGLDAAFALDVSLDIPGAGVEAELRIPPYPEFRNIYGMAYDQETEDGTLWAIGGAAECFDPNGDGATTLDESAIRWEWTPLSDSDGTVPAVAGDATLARAYVRATLTLIRFGWFGLESYPVRASLNVDDSAGYLEVPVSVLYQFPSGAANWGTQYNPINGEPSSVDWGDPYAGNYAYLVVTLDRVAEYRIASPTLGGDVVFSYSSGDFGFMAWENPLDRSACENCADEDGDGWTDQEDPDCDVGDTEVGLGDSQCNDGRDNDRDGNTDADDEDCDSADDIEDVSCDNGEDDDEDGWTDEADPDCASGAAEDDSTFGATGCNDGLDEDADGWIDSDDPDCTDALQSEVGFGTNECNDGIDNDGHSDVDSEDVRCQVRGAGEDEESPAAYYHDDCANGIDDDGDGYVDGNDPGCEYNPYGDESQSNRDYNDECYDSRDNDSDGLEDAADPQCLNAAGEPDGFIDDEATGSTCGGGGIDTGGDTGSGDTGSADTGGDTGSDSGSADTGDTGDSGVAGDTGDTGDTASDSGSGDTAAPVPPPEASPPPPWLTRPFHGFRLRLPWRDPTGS